MLFVRDNAKKKGLESVVAQCLQEERSENDSLNSILEIAWVTLRSSLGRVEYLLVDHLWRGVEFYTGYVAFDANRDCECFSQGLDRARFRKPLNVMAENRFHDGSHSSSALLC